MKKIKKILFLIYFVVLICLILVEIYVTINNFNYSVSPLMSWMILFGWIGFVANYKWNSWKSFYFSLILFLLGAFLVILGFKNFSETILKICFTGLLVAMGQALVEYKCEHKKTKAASFD